MKGTGHHLAQLSPEISRVGVSPGSRAACGPWMRAVGGGVGGCGGCGGEYAGGNMQGGCAGRVGGAGGSAGGDVRRGQGQGTSLPRGPLLRPLQPVPGAVLPPVTTAQRRGAEGGRRPALGHPAGRARQPAGGGGSRPPCAASARRLPGGASGPGTRLCVRHALGELRAGLCPRQSRGGARGQGAHTFPVRGAVSQRAGPSAAPPAESRRGGRLAPPTPAEGAEAACAGSGGSRGRPLPAPGLRCDGHRHGQSASPRP